MNQPSQHSRGVQGNGSDAGPSIEPNSDKEAAPQPGAVEGGAPNATPDTKPGTPPGTQSEHDRQRADND